ncbi:hypothetical protein Bca4012_031342 [Brassica carinata]
MVSREVFFSVLAVISGGGDLAGAIESLRLRNHLSRDVCGEEVLEWLASGEFWRYGQGLGGELHAAATLFISRVFNVWAFGSYFEHRGRIEMKSQPELLPNSSPVSKLVSGKR